MVERPEHAAWDCIGRACERLTYRGGEDEPVDRIAEEIADRGRSDQRQEEKWSRSNPVEAQRIRQRVTPPGQIERFASREIEQSQNPNRRIDREPRHGFQRLADLVLKQKVQEIVRLVQVAEYVAQPVARGPRYDAAIHPRCRRDEGGVGLLRDREGLFVDRLQRVARRMTCAPDDHDVVARIGLRDRARCLLAVRGRSDRRVEVHRHRDRRRRRRRDHQRRGRRGVLRGRSRLLEDQRRTGRVAGNRLEDHLRLCHRRGRRHPFGRRHSHHSGGGRDRCRRRLLRSRQQQCCCQFRDAQSTILRIVAPVMIVPVIACASVRTPPAAST